MYWSSQTGFCQLQTNVGQPETEGISLYPNNNIEHTKLSWTYSQTAPTCQPHLPRTRRMLTYKLFRVCGLSA